MTCHGLQFIWHIPFILQCNRSVLRGVVSGFRITPPPPHPTPSTGYYLLYCTWSSDSLKESTFRGKSMTANPSRTHRDRCDLLKVTFTIQNTAHSLIKWVEDERRGTQDLGVITREVDHGPNRWSIEMSVLQIIFIYLARTSDGRWAGQLEAIV